MSPEEATTPLRTLPSHENEMRSGSNDRHLGQVSAEGISPAINQATLPGSGRLLAAEQVEPPQIPGAAGDYGSPSRDEEEHELRGEGRAIRRRVDDAQTASASSSLEDVRVHGRISPGDATTRFEIVEAGLRGRSEPRHLVKKLCSSRHDVVSVSISNGVVQIFHRGGYNDCYLLQPGESLVIGRPWDHGDAYVSDGEGSSLCWAHDSLVVNWADGDLPAEHVYRCGRSCTCKNRNSRREQEHDWQVGARIGEASHPGPKYSSKHVRNTQNKLPGADAKVEPEKFESRPAGQPKLKYFEQPCTGKHHVGDRAWTMTVSEFNSFAIKLRKAKQEGRDFTFPTACKACREAKRREKEQRRNQYLDGDDLPKIVEDKPVFVDRPLPPPPPLKNELKSEVVRLTDQRLVANLEDEEESKSEDSFGDRCSEEEDSPVGHEEWLMFPDGSGTGPVGSHAVASASSNNPPATNPQADEPVGQGLVSPVVTINPLGASETAPTPELTTRRFSPETVDLSFSSTSERRAAAQATANKPKQETKRPTRNIAGRGWFEPFTPEWGADEFGKSAPKNHFSMVLDWDNLPDKFKPHVQIAWAKANARRLSFRLCPRRIPAEYRFFVVYVVGEPVPGPDYDARPLQHMTVAIRSDGFVRKVSVKIAILKPPKASCCCQSLDALYPELFSSWRAKAWTQDIESGNVPTRLLVDLQHLAVSCKDASLPATLNSVYSSLSINMRAGDPVMNTCKELLLAWRYSEVHRGCVVDYPISTWLWRPGVP